MAWGDTAYSAETLAVWRDHGASGPNVRLPLGEANASRRATYPFDDTPCPISAGLTEEQAQ